MRVPIAPAARPASRKVKDAAKAITYCLAAAGLWVLLCANWPASAQNVQHTRNTADQALRSDLRVDPSTLGLSITIPLGTYPGRAGVSVPVSLQYSSKGLWRMEYGGYYREGPCCEPSFTANPQGLPTENNYSYVSVSYNQDPGSGWRQGLQPPTLVDGFAEYYNFDGDPCAECELSQRFYVQRLRVRMPDGSTHELRRGDTVYTYGNLPQGLGIYVAVDGSRLRYVEGTNNTGTVHLPDGSRYLIGNQTNKYVDRNGNTLTYAGDGRWTDTLGRTVGLALTNNPANPTSDRVYTLTGFGGAPRYYTFRYRYLAEMLGQQAPPTTGDMNVYGAGIYPGLFHSEGGTRVTPPQQFNPAVLYEVELPDGGKYQFTYNEYGEVNKVVFPSGGYERYQYAVIPGLDPVNEPYAQTNRGVTDRWVSAGGDEQHWGYAVVTSPEYKVTATSPDGSYNERRLQRGRGPDVIDFGFDDSRAGMAYDERVFSASGQMLRRELTEWSQTGTQAGASLSATATRDPRVTRKVEILLDTGGSALAKTTTYQYDSDLNVTATSEHDFVQVSQTTGQTGAIDSISAGALLRTSETTFLVNDASVDASTRAAYRARDLLSLPTSTRVRDAAGVIVAQAETKYDESNYTLIAYGPVTGWSDPATIVRGNATTGRSWLDAAGAWVETHAQYDQCGSAVKSWDAKGNLSQVVYSSAYAYAYTTQSISPVPDPTGAQGSNASLVSATAYDLSTGLITSMTDANNKTTSFQYNDPLNRPTRVDLPDGGWTTYAYGRNAYGDYVETRTALDASRSTYRAQMFDGLGRPYRWFVWEGGSSYLTTDTQYDSLGRAWRRSLPYRSAGNGSPVNSLGRWAETSYDALGREKAVKTLPDNASVTTECIGNAVTVTDQAGKKRRSVADALGRLARVDEPDALGNLGTVSAPSQPTSYTYDVLGNLRKVEQGGQARFFTYDSLGRLTRAKNPEQAVNASITGSDPVTGNSQWSYSYSYDYNGNLYQRTDARGVTTAYDYDALNRNTTVTYSGGDTTTPAVKHYYDGAANGKGLLWWAETVGVSATVTDSYDALGRATQHRQNFWAGGVWGQPFTERRVYDLAGNVNSHTYPSGRTVTHTYDAAGRVGGFSGNLGDGVQRAYSSGVAYSEFGGIQHEQFGTRTPLHHKLHYNARGQLYDIRLSIVSWATDQWNWNRGALVLDYGYGPGGQSGAANNGNVSMTQHWVPTNDQMSGHSYTEGRYNYDSLNRLTSVTEYPGGPAGLGAASYAQVYEYDRWGNRTVNQTQTWGAAKPQFEMRPQTNQEIAEPSNRLYAPGDAGRAPSQKLMRYDAAGNLTYDVHTGGGSRTYDAENRMTAAQGVNQSWSYYAYDADGRRVRRTTAGEEWWQVYGAGGELLAEYRAGAAPMSATKEYGYRGGELLVTMASGDDQRVKRFVTNLYYGALQRDPTPQELQDKSNQLASAGAQGQSQLLTKAKEMARSLFTSTAYETSPLRSDTQYVTDLYYAYLQRGADASGLNWWASQVPGGGRSGVCNAFESSSEFAALVATLYGTAASDDERTDHFVTGFYLGALGRFPTSAELQQQRDSLNAAASQGQSQVKSQAEAMGRALFAPQVTDTTITNQQYVTNLYEGFLQRGPDAGGLSFWTSIVGSNGRQYVLDSFATSSSARELAATLYRETFWLVNDQLGTPRMVVNKSGGLAGVKRHDYLSFGEELLAGTGGRTTAQGYGASDNVRQKFTGYERDNETGLDYAQARYYSAGQGRFTSPDDFLNDTSAVDAASWNLYAYVRNNPLRYTDPSGEKIYVGGLSQADRDELLKRTNATYGCRSCVGVDANGYLAVDTSGLNRDVVKATQFLTDAINTTSWYGEVRVSNNDSGVAFGEGRRARGAVPSPSGSGRKINADLIVLDFGDDRWVSSDSRAREAFLNTVFAHEVAHFRLQSGQITRDPKNPGETGPVVDAINDILQAQGLSLRANYFAATRGATGWRYSTGRRKETPATTWCATRAAASR